MLERAELDEVFAGPEVTSIRERLVISPCSGRFVPLPPDVFTSEGEWAQEGQVLAEIRAGRETVPVVSAFSGWVMGMLAVPGQPVDGGEPLFWIRT
jgi:biotin carboxyl carrier protein